MATKKKEEVKEIKKATKKEVKPVSKKITTKKKELVDVKVESKPTFWSKLKKFFNSPQPLIIVLALMVVALLIYNVHYSKYDQIYVGHYTGEDGNISTIHCFTNHKINVFYATPVSYSGEEKKVYGYNIGYYYEDDHGELVPFIVRSGIQENPVPIKKIVEDNSYFNISELSTTPGYFTEEAKDHMDKLHFVIMGSTIEGADTADFMLDLPIEFDKIV